MVVLRTLALCALATACYAPDLRDCTVTCSRADECAPGQICGADGLCAATARAGRCAQATAPDAGVADAPPDAWPTVDLVVRIDGRGSVAIPTIGDCVTGEGPTSCPFTVPRDVPRSLHATPAADWRFERWKEACDGEPTTTCTITPIAKTTVRVKFVNDD